MPMPMTNDANDIAAHALSSFKSACSIVGAQDVRVLEQAIAVDGGGGQSAQLAQGLVKTCRSLLVDPGGDVLLRVAQQEQDANVPDLQTGLGEYLGSIRRLSTSDDIWHSFADYSVYYVWDTLCALITLMAIVLFLEGFILRTTLFTRVTDCAQALSRWTGRFMKSLRKRGGVATQPATNVDKKADADPSFSEQDCEKFWETLRSAVKAKRVNDRTTSTTTETSDAPDTVAFTRRSFSGLEQTGVAKIVLERSGKLQGPVVVQVRTADDLRAAGFAAEAKLDYEPLDVNITLDDGEASKTFEIKLLQTNKAWTPTRWFRIELVQVVSGTAVLGGPKVATSIYSEFNVRVYILQDDMFPGGISAAKLDSPNVDLWVLLYYLKDRVKARGRRFWKAMAGYCYVAVHGTVVTPIVFKYMLDWATDPENGGSYNRILFLTSIQALSYLLLRWGDILTTRNRGRTGGTRMLHRQQLLSKLLMMEHAEQYRYPGGDWFYAALQNVDVMASSAYWQLFVMGQNLFGLLLCVAVLLWKAWYDNVKKGKEINVGNLLPAVVLLFLTPIAFVVIFCRRKTTKKYLDKRMDGEEKWVEIFAWLAQHGRKLFALGVREIAEIDSSFSKASSEFIEHHQRARDWTNDSTWITKWIGAFAYCLIMAWASLRLLHNRMDILDGFTTGDFVMLVQLFGKFAKYLTKVSNSYVSMQKGSVSILRVARLLRLLEQKSLYDQALEDQETEAPGVGENTDSILVQNLVFEVPKDLKQKDGLGPLADLKQKDGVPLSVPLGKVVFIKGGTEAEQLSILMLLAQLLKPTTGSVAVPSEAWSILMPSAAFEMPFPSIKEDYIVSGSSPDAATNMMALLDLDPKDRHVKLPPGKAALHALSKYLLRDPAILLALRPFSSVPPELRLEIFNLMVAWQWAGGGKALSNLLDKKMSFEEYLQDARKTGPSANGQRSLILSGDDLPDWLPQEHLHVIDICDFFRDDHDPVYGPSLGGLKTRRVTLL